jgi:hypothetical protein
MESKVKKGEYAPELARNSAPPGTGRSSSGARSPRLKVNPSMRPVSHRIDTNNVVIAEDHFSGRAAHDVVVSRTARKAAVD